VVKMKKLCKLEKKMLKKLVKIEIGNLEIRLKKILEQDIIDNCQETLMEKAEQLVILRNILKKL